MKENLMSDRTQPPPEASEDRSAPPPDEIMARVVGEWKGWKEAHFYPPRISNPFGEGSWRSKPDDYSAPVEVDPRFCTDAALELLGCLIEKCLNHTYDASEQGEPALYMELSGHAFNKNPENHPSGYFTGNLPICGGQPFRTAICWLAVDVMGVNTN